MIRTVTQKITKISIAIALIAQNIFPPCSLHASPSAKDRPPVHFFDLQDDPQDMMGNSLKETARQNLITSHIVDNELPEAESDDWKLGWKGEEKFADGDLASFFTEEFATSREAQTTSPDNSPIPQKSSPELHPISIDDSSLDYPSNPIVKKMLSITRDESIQNSKSQHDTGHYAWDLPPPISQHADEISTAKIHSSAIIEDQISLTESEKTVGYPEAPQKMPLELGKKIVTVDPYLSIEDNEKTTKGFRETPSSSKTGEAKQADQSPAWGVSIPQSISAKKTDANLPSGQLSENEVIAQTLPDNSINPGRAGAPPKTILINFNNVSIIEYIRFISRITNRNFIFDENDLQFNVTIISEEPTTIENVMTALIQELRIHGLHLIEKDNSFIIHKNSDQRSISRVNTNGAPNVSPRESELVTQVFKLNTLDPERAQRIVAPLLSTNAIIETSEDTRHVIITDLVTNIKEVEILFKDIDSPNSGLVIGQYVVRNSFIDSLIELAKQIMEPIAKDQSLTFVPHTSANSIFIVSSPFLVERTISVLQHLDQFQGTTRIFDLDELKFQQAAPARQIPGLTPELQVPDGRKTPEQQVPAAPVKTAEGKWEISPKGNWIFRPGFPQPIDKNKPSDLPQGNWLLDPQNRWYFNPEGTAAPFSTGIERRGKAELQPGEAPRGRWVLDPQGSWIFQLSPEEEIAPKRFTRPKFLGEELPVGHIERIKFYIHKLHFRRGRDIVQALGNIGNSLSLSEAANPDLIIAIQSVQWLEGSNSLVFTGTEPVIEKVRELIEEIDRPLRQVFIEMLILDTTLQDSLNYGVSWATRSGGGNTATAQSFIGGASPLTSIINADGAPDSSNILSGIFGYTLGVIGRRLTHNGTQFATIGALISALHDRTTTKVVMNPKIITEDNKPAEIFVGLNLAFQTSSISNDLGSVITSNYEYRDVGTTLRVTPLIGGDIITLDIEEEVSSIVPTPNTITNTANTPTTRINRTTTTVHVPNKHFVIISGLMDDEKNRSRNQFPCLGGIPIIGAAFSAKVNNDVKRNLMIFIMPQIVDTDDELRQLTSDQQEIYRQKNRTLKDWKYEVDEGMDLLNIKPSCNDECNECY